MGMLIHLELLFTTPVPTYHLFMFLIVNLE